MDGHEIGQYSTYPLTRSADTRLTDHSVTTSTLVPRYE